MPVAGEWRLPSISRLCDPAIRSSGPPSTLSRCSLPPLLHRSCCTPPKYIDKFWDFRQMQDATRSNMAELFFPCWVVCLDESMSIRHCQWTCPGVVFCPRKPHHLGSMVSLARSSRSATIVMPWCRAMPLTSTPMPNWLVLLMLWLEIWMVYPAINSA